MLYTMFFVVLTLPWVVAFSILIWDLEKCFIDESMKYNVVGGSTIDFDIFKKCKLLVGIPEFKTLRLLNMWQCCSKDGLIYRIIDEYKLTGMLDCMNVKLYRLTIWQIPAINRHSYCSNLITPEFQNAFVYTVYLFIEKQINDERFCEILEYLFKHINIHCHLWENPFDTITVPYLLKNIYVESLKLIHNSLAPKHKHAFTELSELILKLYLKHHNSKT